MPLRKQGWLPSWKSDAAAKAAAAKLIICPPPVKVLLPSCCVPLLRPGGVLPSCTSDALMQLDAGAQEARLHAGL